MGNDADKESPKEDQATPQGEPAPAPPKFAFFQFQFPDITKVPTGRMVALFVLLGLLIYLQGPSRPVPLEPSHDGVRKDVIAVIESQLAAFRSNDWQTAYTLAAAPLRQQYSASAFEKMVREGYPVIANSTTAQFGVATDNGREAMILVFVQGRNGWAANYQYFLIREDGRWKISGVNPGRPAVPTRGDGRLG